MSNFLALTLVKSGRRLAIRKSSIHHFETDTIRNNEGELLDCTTIYLDKSESEYYKVKNSFDCILSELNQGGCTDEH